MSTSCGFVIHTIPSAALAQHLAILGKTGSGKSYAMRGVVEQLLEDSARVCIVDPTGAWYGLRTMADGKRAGYPVAIFGGNHSDFPLQQHHGEELAEIIGTSSTPAILDVSLLRTGERTRLFTDFAEGLLRKNRGPLHLVVDEAHLFAPQGRVNDPQSGAMLHAANNLVSLGRSRGLRIALITQRPAKLHKDSLTQVETLVAMRLIAPQDRKAVEEWIKDNADDARGREVLSSLASLKTGQGWIWAPELGVLDRVTFPKIRTLDSGRAPDGSDIEGKVLAAIDREAIATRLKVVAQEAEANDPKKLRARIAELQKQLAQQPAADAEPDPTVARQLEQRGFERALIYMQGQFENAEAAFSARVMTAFNDVLNSTSRPVMNPPADEAEARNRNMRLHGQRTAPPRAGKFRGTNTQSEARPVSATAHLAVTDLPKGEAATLAALIQYPGGLRREQLTVLTAYKRSSRDAYIQRLRERGLVEAAGERVAATQTGIDAMPNAQPLPTGIELQEFWLQRLPEGERKILQVLLEANGKTVDRAELDELTGYKRSSRDAYLQRLAAKELISEPVRGQVAAAEALF
jgi:hypothetical protein